MTPQAETVSDLDILAIAQDINNLLLNAPHAQWSSVQSLSEEHIQEMLEGIINKNIQGPKAHRWLGWLQAAIVAAGVSSLEEMKVLNSKHKLTSEKNPPFPFKQYMSLVRSAMNTYHHWSYGEILFNVLRDGWPDLAKEIEGTDIDPFNTTEGKRIHKFLLTLATKSCV